MQSGGAGLAKVTVVAPTRRMDVAVPAYLPVAELLPDLLDRAGEHLAEDGEQHGGWALRRADGAELDVTRPLVAQSVRDGDVLHMSPARHEWPELEYDDVFEAVAAGSRRHGRSWSSLATRVFALSVAGAVALAGLAMLSTVGPPWSGPGIGGLSVGVVLLAGGIALSRALGDPVSGAVVAGLGLLYAFVGGCLLTGPGYASLAEFGGAQVLLGAVWLLLFGIVGYVAVGAYARLFAAGIFTGLFGALGAVFGLLSMSVASSAALILSVVVTIFGGFPLLALRFGKLPVPAVPQTPDDIRRAAKAPASAEVLAAVSRSDEVLTGLLLGAASICAAATVPLLADGGGFGAGLVATVGAALLLRSRLFPTVRHRIPLLCVGLLMVLGPMVAGILLLPAGARTAVSLAAVLVLVGLAVSAGVVYSRTRPTPYLGRVADILDTLLIVAVLPQAAAVMGLYGFARGLAG